MRVRSHLHRVRLLRVDRPHQVHEAPRPHGAPAFRRQYPGDIETADTGPAPLPGLHRREVLVLAPAVLWFDRSAHAGSHPSLVVSASYAAAHTQRSGNGGVRSPASDMPASAWDRRPCRRVGGNTAGGSPSRTPARSSTGGSRRDDVGRRESPERLGQRLLTGQPPPAGPDQEGHQAGDEGDPDQPPPAEAPMNALGPRSSPSARSRAQRPRQQIRPSSCRTRGCKPVLSWEAVDPCARLERGCGP